MTELPAAPFHVDVVGAGTPPVVLVHGFGAHGGFWRKWLPHLSPRHEVHVVDLMGFGQGAIVPGGDYSPLAQGEHLARFLRQLEGPPPLLVGHSLGAGIAVAATLRLLDTPGSALPAGLALISGAVYRQRLPFFMRLARIPGLGELFLPVPPPRFVLRLGLRGIVGRPGCVDETMVELYRRPLESRRRRRAILRACRQVAPEKAAALTARLGELTVPVLLVWGEEDRIVSPEGGRRLASELPQARLVTLPEVGHLPPEEAPEDSVKPVLDFLAGELDPSHPGR